MNRKEAIFLIIGCDIDNCIYNTAEAVLSVYDEDTGQHLELSDITSYDMSEFILPQYKKDFYMIFEDRQVWDRVELLPNCFDSIKRLHESGHKIYFVTSSSVKTIPIKYELLKRDFPFLDIRDRLIVTQRKQMIKLDVLIDDYQDNLINADYHGILFNYPWNRDFNEDGLPIYRSDGWEDIQWLFWLIENKRNGRL